MSYSPETAPDVYWFIPSGGDGRHLGAPTRTNAFPYLASVANAADTLGFDGVLLPTGGHSEDTLVVASALSALTRQLRFLVALRPGLISPILAARLTASLDRVSNGRVNLNIVTGSSGGSGGGDLEGLDLTHAQRYELTREWLGAFRAALSGETVDLDGAHLKIRNGRAPLPSVQRPYPPIYFGGSSDAARAVAGEHVDVYLTWGERPGEVAQKLGEVRAEAARHGRTVRFGLRAHVVVRDTEDEAWQAAEDLLRGVSDETVEKAQAAFLASGSEGQRRMAALHGGRRDALRIGKNLWAGVGLVRGGAGTAFVGSPENVVAALNEYRALGVDTFVLSGYPHLEEAYRVAELLFPLLGKTSPILRPHEGTAEPATGRVPAPIGRFTSI